MTGASMTFSEPERRPIKETYVAVRVSSEQKEALAEVGKKLNLNFAEMCRNALDVWVHNTPEAKKIFKQRGLIR